MDLLSKNYKSYCQLQSCMIHLKYDAPVFASDKRFVLPDDVMKYQVCFIVAIEDLGICETIHHRG